MEAAELRERIDALLHTADAEVLRLILAILKAAQGDD